MFRLSRAGGDWRWDEMPSMRTGRFIPGVAASGALIVVIGGQASFDVPPIHPDQPGPYVNAVEAFDTADPDRGWYDLPPIPGPPRDGVAIATIDDRVYVFGGNYVKYEQMTGGNFHDERRGCGDAYVLDLTQVRWRKLPDVPHPTQGWKAVSVRRPLRRYRWRRHGTTRSSTPMTTRTGCRTCCRSQLRRARLRYRRRDVHRAADTQIPPYVTREPELQDRLEQTPRASTSPRAYIA